MFCRIFAVIKKNSTFALAKWKVVTLIEFINGAIAQLVEQRTENPCVPGSIPGGTTQMFRKKKVTIECHR